MNKKNRTYVSYTLQMPKVLMSKVKKTARRIGVSPAWIVKKCVSEKINGLQSIDFNKDIKDEK